MVKYLIAATTLILTCCSSAFALHIDETAPLFTLRDKNGDNFFVSDYVGQQPRKPVKGIILNFFASYCKPCRHELPVLDSLVPEFEKKGLKVVTVGFKEDFDKIAVLLAELKVNKPVVLADPYGRAGDRYGVRSLPMTFFIDSGGRVTDIIIGELPELENELRARAEKLLK